MRSTRSRSSSSLTLGPEPEGLAQPGVGLDLLALALGAGRDEVLGARPVGVAAAGAGVRSYAAGLRSWPASAAAAATSGSTAGRAAYACSCGGVVGRSRSSATRRRTRSLRGSSRSTPPATRAAVSASCWRSAQWLGVGVEARRAATAPRPPSRSRRHRLRAVRGSSGVGPAVVVGVAPVQERPSVPCRHSRAAGARSDEYRLSSGPPSGAATTCPPTSTTTGRRSRRPRARGRRVRRHGDGQGEPARDRVVRRVAGQIP